MKNTLQRYGLLGYLQIFGVNYNILQHVLIDSTISLTFGGFVVLIINIILPCY